MKRIQRSAVVLGLVCAAGARLAVADDAAGGVTVLTTLPVTYSIATALAKGTHVTVQNVPDNGRRMNAQQNYFTLQADKLQDQFKHADAVITIGKLWQDDPLFVAYSGTDATPAISGFDPGVGADLYITNGTTDDYSYAKTGTLSWTVELN